MHPKKLIFFPGVSCWNKKRGTFLVLVSAKGELVTQKKISHGPTLCQTTLQEETEYQSKMDVPWAASHLDQDCLDTHIPSLLPKFEDAKDGLEEISDSVCPSSQCGHTE